MSVVVRIENTRLRQLAIGQMISEQKGEIIGVQDVVIKARSSQAGSARSGIA